MRRPFARALTGATLGATLVVASLFATTLPGTANAGPFTWPNVPERIERGLGSTDVAERRAVARRLSDLPRDVAAPLLRRALGDPDVEVRLLAAAAAVRAELPSAGDLVVPWISESDVRLRLAACNVVRAAPTRASVAALGRSLADASADVRAAAASALGASTYVEAVSALLGHVDDASPEARAEVVRALGRLRDPRAVLPLVGRLQDAAPEVRRAAARALRELGDPRAASALVVALADASPQVRLEAVEALGSLRASEAVLALVPIALGNAASSPSSTATNAPRAESTEVLRAAALRALARIGEPRAIEALVAALPLDDPDAGDVARGMPSGSPPAGTFPGLVRISGSSAVVPTAIASPNAPLGSATPAADALVAAGAAAVPALEGALRASLGPRAATSAARALAAIDGRAAVPAIGRAMLAGALPVRAGLEALGRTGRPEALPMVLERLDDPEPLVRSTALEAALTIVDPARPDGRLIDPVAASLRDARRPLEERIALVRLLGRSGSPRAHPVLLALLAPVRDDRGGAVPAADQARRVPLRVASLEALGVLGLPAAGTDRALLAALGDEAPAVRRAAASALARTGSPTAVPALAQRLIDGAEQDRAALAIALSGVASRARSGGAGEAGGAGEGGEALVDVLGRAPSDVRDGLLEALGRAPGEAARDALLQGARSLDADERRKVAESLAGHTDLEARRALRELAVDLDASVRASAVWALARVGERSDVELLAKAIGDLDGAVSGNAVASLARLAARLRAPEAAAATLCRVLDDRRPYVVVNALAGLEKLGGPALVGCDLSRVGGLFASRRPAVVRAAAARFARASSAGAATRPDFTSWLSRCALDERDAEIASLCAAPPSARIDGAPASTEELLVFVVMDGGREPRARAPFALARPDGMVRLGLADRRGAVFERDLLPGEVRLEVPAPLVP